jgi:hypothetical protein
MYSAMARIRGKRCLATMARPLRYQYVDGSSGMPWPCTPQHGVSEEPHQTLKDSTLSWFSGFEATMLRDRGPAIYLDSR